MNSSQRLHNFVGQSSASVVRHRISFNDVETAVGQLREECCSSEILDSVLVDLSRTYSTRSDIWVLAYRIVATISDERSGKREQLLLKLNDIHAMEFASSPSQDSSLEAITSADPFLSPRELGSWCLRAMQQVCRVRCGEDERGTGFLVGPSLVLTCHHVVDSFLSGSLRQKIAVCFDDPHSAGPSQWLKVDSTWDIPASPPSSVDTIPNSLTLPEDGKLDYAILRLQSAAGSQRGFIHVSNSTELPATGTPVFIAGHPGPNSPLQPLRVSLAAPGYDGHNGNMSRLVYRASTRNGSSGSPVFDRTFRPIALHHNRGQAGAGTFALNNRGVPLFAICKHLGVKSLEDLELPGKSVVKSLEASVPAGAIPPEAEQGEKNSNQEYATGWDESPFLGRERLRTCVRELRDGRARILAIDGLPKTGRTFSFRFISDVCYQREEKCISVQLVNGSGAEVSANQIVQTIVDDCQLGRAGFDQVFSGSHKTLPRRLAIWLAEQVKAEPKPVWICMERLDHHEVSPSLRQFISSLVKQVATISNIRLVLIGKLKGLTQVPAAWTTRETIYVPEVKDCVEYLRVYLMNRGKPQDEKSIRKLLEPVEERLPPRDNSWYITVLALEMRVLMMTLTRP